MSRIYFKDLSITQISNSSGVFTGQNLQVKWRNTKKTNEGFGKVSGDYNMVTRGRHVVLDPDLVDFAIQKSSVHTK